MKKRIFPIALCLFLLGCTAKVQAPKPVAKAPLTRLTLHKPGSADVTVMAEIADTPRKQEQGLMNRTSLQDGQGMLFVFKEAQLLHFWMKNTLIPLDIVFFDQQNTAVSVLTMEPCAADPCPLYGPDSPAITALELPKGFAAKNGISTGWKLTW